MTALNIFEIAADVEVSEVKDTLGGFQCHETGLYAGVLKTAYIDRFASGSVYINAVFELTDDKGTTFKHTERETIWSANTQGNFYIDKKTGKKKLLIGFSKMDNLFKLLSGKSMQELSVSGGVENKVHKVYNKEASKEMPTELATFTAITESPVCVALVKQIENKQTKQGNAWVDSAETREVNFVDRIFNGDRKTLLEVQNSTPAAFADEWLKANEGKTRDKSKKVAAQSGMPTAAPTASLNLNI